MQRLVALLLCASSALAFMPPAPRVRVVAPWTYPVKSSVVVLASGDSDPKTKTETYAGDSTNDANDRRGSDYGEGDQRSAAIGESMDRGAESLKEDVEKAQEQLSNPGEGAKSIVSQAAHFISNPGESIREGLAEGEYNTRTQWGTKEDNPENSTRDIRGADESIKSPGQNTMS